MSTPKKPGTDLAALKARLAKKTKAAQPQAAQPGGPANVPAPGQVIPAPGQQVAPQPQPSADVPPPGQVSQPLMDVPPPGQVSEPLPAMAEPAPPVHDPDDPFSAPGAVGFDPSEGVIEGGEVQARSNKGLIIFAALVAMAFGAAVGWLGHKIIDTKERIGVGKAKGAQMVEEVAAVADVRKTVSLEMEELQKKAVQEPEAAAAQLEKLLTEQFDKHPKVDQLFGWQLASVHTNGIKRTFDLYEEANRLKLDLGYLATFLKTHKDQLEASGGPLLFALLFKSDGAQLVLALQPLCGESLENLEALQPCGAQEGNNAIAYKIQESPGAQPRIVPRGTEPDQAMMLLTDGPIYQFAIGEKPERNAGIIRDAMLGRVKERLEAMAKAEKTALRALSNYADDPNIDGSSPPPDPGGGDEEEGE